LRLVWAASAAWVYALTVSIVFGYVTSWEAVSAWAATVAGAVLYVVFFVRLARQR
jgi:hypothetical protein